MRVALCQIPVSSRPSVNLDRVRAAMRDAAGQGADLAVFPEATLVRFGSDLAAAAEPLDGPFCSALAAEAKEPLRTDSRAVSICANRRPKPNKSRPRCWVRLW